MSVIVMGMDYPKHCFQCLFKHSGISDFCTIEDRDFDDEDFEDLEREDWHPDWCPLRPLPEKHGRLIDADAFIGTIRPIVEEDDYAVCTFRTVKELMTEHIDEAPTIVETEGE
ncbi:MAG: hypothetical protein J6J18_11955 [Oscillospiraceae bacterium]|nr:hypothetical protein [Oscillospiraceae bacterium]